MTKFFFISDIHGSAYYTRIALEKFKKENADYIVILGDELYHGARNPLPSGYNPKEVIHMLNEYSDKIIAIKGNCDSEVDQMVLNFPMMSQYSILVYDKRRLFLTHGHIYNEKNLPKLNRGDVFVYGHTHILKAEKKDSIYIVNPGSITFPKNNNRNSYAILENDVFKIKDLDGKLIKEIELN